MSNVGPSAQARSLVRRYLERFETSGFNRFTGFDWASVRGELLTEEQLGAVKTAMLVEDHIPGYSGAYHRMFALDPGLPAEELAFRRQMLHFVFRWSFDEDRHAHVLENYLRATGRVDSAALDSEMLSAVVRPYAPPHDNSLQTAVYTVIQEKATQVFYSCLGEATAEPVLKDIMRRLSEEEARHCGFFADLLRLHLSAPTSADYANIKEAVSAFKMPLHDILADYKRRSIVMMRAAPGYHYRDAFVLIEQAVRRYADARGDSRSSTLEDLLAALDERGRSKPVAAA